MVGKIGFVSLGCPKALVDSELILTQLSAEGYETAKDYSGADLVVVNTCGFIDSAVEESLSAIGEALAENGKVIVTGCLGARKNADGSDLILSIHPKVLAVTGPHATDEVMQAIHLHLPKPHDPFTDLVPPAGVKLTPKHYAYLKISEGCNHRCTFCIIPSLRGDLVSRPIGEVLLEAKRLFESGVKELLVVSQDTSAYGVDIQYRTGFWDGKPVKTRMFDLVNALNQIAREHQAWVRLHYVYPYPHVDDILPLMAEFSEHGYGVLPYLDIPLQHAHPDVLKRMKRPASGEKNLERILAWREACPDLVIRSTFIAGFPGETEEEFEYLLNFLEEAQIDRAGCFAYSPVEGAKANELDNPVPDAVREERRARFMAKAEDISIKRLAKKIGKRVQVLIDRVDESGGIGRTIGDAPEIDGLVRVLPPTKPSKRYRTGEIIRATVISSQGHDLIAET
ncbi:30S ribosomal protein S12 methylthiotransferase RimO [Polynucleobacter asymbioticus]|uniref:Ribosomal protein uS12 methylthiotransferase RimO n=1 Tax=Polynucleobacter asymbioticus (strain DSM 18221 / CIP 109841 / QLW-P1DMWA-1) TaxID=312153 RepID=RIMO_POLAQ|nr:30S ribosomal protein S12 methylthiotransferase RimO [Polynucleobacter asymbioticus]A4SXC8.1 RecName: Full=Ribosomal protein uS12 methylthiotransferase RimO; Short=uS12 MTTase; Short=uS12 methylthiotransferase; AltName: Full=Ribosomal protein uS12 (aspartate-C(3))-methylthiotransferase; AltName: Full=Ribosome maturation factor RimO [Polynucleobacter asymbioticus QLW-P1DMWA-1]ABP34142.1 SSU ribosomal protein S12P methylthiotransferase [Polynucleobacter asymbioticus QLW-P1DMWA-1]APC05984.1 ribo